MLTILTGDALTKLRELPDESVKCCVTSPPYWGLRDYGTASWGGGDNGCDHKQGRDGAGRADGIVDERGQRNRDGAGAMGGDCGKCGAKRIDSQLGLEKTPEEYVAKMVEVFREVRRVLLKDGTLWLNLGDSYNSDPAKGGSGTPNGRNIPEMSYGRSSRSGFSPGETIENKSTGEQHKFVEYLPDDPMYAGIIMADGERLAVTDLSKFRRTTNLKPKDLCGIPWRVAFALQADGWYLRQDIIWAKPNPMPESVTDRCTKSHEYLFLLTKSAKYYYDYRAILEPAAYDGRMDTVMKGSQKYANGFSPFNEQTKDIVGHERWPNTMPDNFKGSLPGRKDGPGQDRRSDKERIAYNQKGDDYGPNGQAFNQMHAVDGVPARNKRSVWTVTTQPYPDAHFATYPPDLIKPCVMAGTRAGDTVLDPFAGSGTTGMVSLELGRKAILIELNQKYVELIEQRCDVTPGLPL